MSTVTPTISLTSSLLLLICWECFCWCSPKEIIEQKRKSITKFNGGWRGSPIFIMLDSVLTNHQEDSGMTLMMTHQNNYYDQDCFLHDKILLSYWLPPPDYTLLFEQMKIFIVLKTHFVLLNICRVNFFQQSDQA